MFHRAGRIVLAFALAALAAVSAQAQMPAASPDLNKLADEAQGWLGDLVRINSVNPPGNEAVVAKYISAIFQKEGISNEVLEMAPGRSIVVARLQAGPLPDPANALLLVAHQDTVGVDASKWTADPFAATIRDGYMWGRGAVDDKAMLTANIATMVQLKRSKTRLARDVLFLATDDEEQGGPASIKVVVQKYWDKIACAYALNEGGRIIIKDGKVQYVGVQASEKVAYNVIVTATGSSGHGSLPKPDNAVVHLAAAVQKLGHLSGAGGSPARSCCAISSSFPKLKTMKLQSGCALWSSRSAPILRSITLLNKVRCGTPCFGTRLRRRCCRPACASMWFPRLPPQI